MPYISFLNPMPSNYGGQVPAKLKSKFMSVRCVCVCAFLWVTLRSKTVPFYLFARLTSLEEAISIDLTNYLQLKHANLDWHGQVY